MPDGQVDEDHGEEQPKPGQEGAGEQGKSLRGGHCRHRTWGGSAYEASSSHLIEAIARSEHAFKFHSGFAVWLGTFLLFPAIQPCHPRQSGGGPPICRCKSNGPVRRTLPGCPTAANLIGQKYGLEGNVIARATEQERIAVEGVDLDAHVYRAGRLEKGAGPPTSRQRGESATAMHLVFSANRTSLVFDGDAGRAFVYPVEQ